MFKSDEEINTLLDHPKNYIFRGIGKGNNPESLGHGKGAHPRLTLDEKSDIAVLATLVGNKTAAALTGEHPAAVSHHRIGIDGMGVPQADLKEATANKLVPLRDKAIDKVGMLLDIISKENIDGESLGVKDAAIAADKVTSVFERLAPKLGIQIGDHAKVVFYAPKQREAVDYPVIDVDPAKG